MLPVVAVLADAAEDRAPRRAVLLVVATTDAAGAPREEVRQPRRLLAVPGPRPAARPRLVARRLAAPVPLVGRRGRLVSLRRCREHGPVVQAEETHCYFFADGVNAMLGAGREMGIGMLID